MKKNAKKSGQDMKKMKVQNSWQGVTISWIDCFLGLLAACSLGYFIGLLSAPQLDLVQAAGNPSTAIAVESSTAQVQGIATDVVTNTLTPAVNNSAPVQAVPVEVALKGRLAVDDYLSSEADATPAVGIFQPWLIVDDNSIVIATTNAMTAKWLGPNGEDVTLDLVYDQNGSLVGVEVPVSHLEHGFVVVTDDTSDLIVWDFEDGGKVAGSQVEELLGAVQSSDVRATVNPSTIDKGDCQFYVDGGKIYGKFPFLDLVTTSGKKAKINFKTVWGQDTNTPSHIYVTPIFIAGDNPNSLQVGVERKLPHILIVGGGADTNEFLVNIPDGAYKIRATFAGAQDWAADSNGKG